MSNFIEHRILKMQWYKSISTSFHSEIKMTNIILEMGLSWVVRIRPTVHIWDLNLWAKVPSVGVFLRDPSPYLREFQW